MRALRMRRIQQDPTPPRPRSPRQPVPRGHTSPALLRIASDMQARAERAEQICTDWQHRFEEQAHELQAARSQIEELRRQLAAVLSPPGPGPGPAPEPGPGPGPAPEPGPGPGPGPGPTPEPGPGPPGGVRDLLRRLQQCQRAHRELVATIGELQARLSNVENRCTELEQQLQRALRLAEGNEPPASGLSWDAENAARVQERAAILTIELERVRRQRDDILAERDRLSARVLSLILPDQNLADAMAARYQYQQDPLFLLMREELLARDRYATWRARNGRTSTERVLDGTRSLDEQALEATLAVRRQLVARPPLRCPSRPRWVLEGFLLDPDSEQYLQADSRRRVAFRERRMAEGTVPVT